MPKRHYSFFDLAKKNDSPKEIYQNLLNFCRGRKIKVIHKKDLTDTAWYNFQQRTIWVPAKYKGKPWGIHFLVHELTHWFDHAQGAYNAFFEDNGNETPLSARMGILAENNAEKQTEKFLKKAGIFL